MKKKSIKKQRHSKKNYVIKNKNPHIASHFETSIAQLSPTLQEEMRQLKDQEEKILMALRDPITAQRFLENPGAVLQEQGVELGPISKRRLDAFDANLAEHLRTQTFLLPNGQTVTANISVNFIGTPKEG